MVKWLTCVLLAFALLSGCNMFGTPDFYAAIAEACARCHIQGQQPSKATVMPKPAPGMEGPGGVQHPGCPMDCPFALGR